MGVGGGTYEKRLRKLRELRHHIDVMELRFAEEASEFAALPVFSEAHADSAISVLRDECHMTAGAAAKAICVGDQLEHLPESEVSLRRSEIGFSHLGLIAYTCRALRESETSRGFDEEPLLIKARQVSVKGLIRACTQYRHQMDPKAYEQAERSGTESRFLELQARDDGSVWLKGFFDNEGGAVLRSALEPLAQKEGYGDDRPQSQRYADALVELAGGGYVPAQVQISASLESLAKIAGAPAAEIEFGSPLSMAALRRATCDCSLLGPESLVIDVGRARRTVGPAQRRALSQRDGGCRWPGCLRPASKCAGHHLKHWANGGETKLDHLILLCGRHHWLVHEGGWQLQGTIEDGFIAVPPRPSWLTDRPAA